MTLPSSASKVNSDEITDDPAQSILADLAGLVDKFNDLIDHLGISPVTSTPLSLGDGLEVSSTTFRVKLQSNSGLSRDSNGIAINSAAKTTGRRIAGTRLREAGIVTVSSNFTVGSTQTGTMFVANSTGTVTATLPALSTGTNGQAFEFYNVGTGDFVIDGNGSDTVDGLSSITLTQNASARIIQDNDNSDNHTNVAGNLRTGKHTAVVQAGGFTEHPESGGPSVTTFNPGSAIGFVSVPVAVFEDTSNVYTTFSLKMPKSWDEGSLDCYVHWTQDGSASGNALFEVAGVALGDNDSFNVSYGTGFTVSDTALGQYEKMRTSAITFTPSGSPADNDEIAFRFARLGASTLDTLSTTVLVRMIEIVMSLDAGNDA